MSNNYETYEVQVYSNGDKLWFQKGKRHRLDGPACEWSDGTKSWWQMGNLHRLDGPAYEGADGTKEWYQMGKLHRLDGPAREWSNGVKNWFIEGKLYSEQEFNKKINQLNNPTCDGKMVEIEGKKYRLQLVED